MYIEIKTLKDDTYRNFVSQHLMKSQYIVVSMTDDEAPPFNWEVVSIPKNIEFRTILISENEQPYCYKNNYYDIYTTFKMYRSMQEFFEVTNIYRFILVSHNAVAIECRCDEVTVYNIEDN